ncbi:MAG: hypothetical protein ACREAC_25565, partial [Blastocatellia bacterium]
MLKDETLILHSSLPRIRNAQRVPRVREAKGNRRAMTCVIYVFISLAIPAFGAGSIRQNQLKYLTNPR